MASAEQLSISRSEGFVTHAAHPLKDGLLTPVTSFKGEICAGVQPPAVVTLDKRAGTATVKVHAPHSTTHDPEAKAINTITMRMPEDVTKVEVPTEEMLHRIAGAAVDFTLDPDRETMAHANATVVELGENGAGRKLRSDARESEPLLNATFEQFLAEM